MTVNVQARVEKLLKKMTLKEKVAQLCAIPVEEFLEHGRFRAARAGELLKNGIGITRVAGWGKWEPVEAAEITNAIQKILVEKTKLAIPAIVHDECLTGFHARRATQYPHPIGLASTFEPGLVRRMTDNIRKEMRAVGTHQGLSPVLDVLRDPRWGRVEETYGEDHYLVACFAVAYVKGLQGEDLKEGVIATPKHFAAHGFSEGGRNHAPVHVGPREFREVFLYPFEMAVKEAGALSIMNAYHDIDGVPCAADRELLTGILRNEWGFEGYIVSDYSSILMLVTDHFTAANYKEAAAQALEAGLDVELPRIVCYGDPLMQALKEGLVSEETLDTSVRRVLKAKILLGLFENPYVDLKQAGALHDAPEHRALALEMARKSIVLLKNEANFLPLAKDIDSIAVIGPNAADPRGLLGDYHFTATPDSVAIVTVLEGIRRKVTPGTQVRYARGCDVKEISIDGFAQAVEIARQSDVAILVVGGRSGMSSDYTTGEAVDRAGLDLPGAQQELVEEIQETGTPVVVVLVNGRPFSIEWIDEHVKAVVEAWLPAEEGGTAIADVLFGDYNPGGKLPLSVPRTVGQLPVHYNRKPKSLKDYVFTKNAPLYPFGHGLSYTGFRYNDLKVSPKKVKKDGTVTISLKVKNTGEHDGDEVVQLYIRDVVASLARPVKELKGFERVTVKAGKEKKVTFKLPVPELAFYDRNVNLVVEPGTFKVMLGSSSEDIRLEDTFKVF